MRRLVLLLAILASTAPLAAARPDHLTTLLKGRIAEPAKRCITPDRAVQPEIIDSTAIVYRDARYTYVGRFKGGCAPLRENRTIITRTSGGQLCENDPVRVVEATGAGFGFCTFDKFTPYRKRR